MWLSRAMDGTIILDRGREEEKVENFGGMDLVAWGRRYAAYFGSNWRGLAPFVEFS